MHKGKVKHYQVLSHVSERSSPQYYDVQRYNMMNQDFTVPTVSTPCINDSLEISSYDARYRSY